MISMGLPRATSLMGVELEHAKAMTSEKNITYKNYYILETRAFLSIQF
jgi:hypothetical protein